MESEVPSVVHPMPKGLLVSIVDLIEWISEKSGGLITVPEVADAITRAYDGDLMPLFDGGYSGLADEMGPRGDEVKAYNYRVDTVCEIFNSRYWKIPDAMIFRTTPVRDIMIRKADGQILAKLLWARFFPDADFVGDVSSIAGFKLTSSQVTTSPSCYEQPSEFEISGPTFARLQRAIASFSGRYPEYKTKPPKLDDDVRPWLKESGLGENDAERRVFGAIIREHFKLSPDTQKT